MNQDTVNAIVVTATLSLLAFLLYKIFFAIRDAGRALGDMAEGAVIALAKHHERSVQEGRIFYTRTWTQQEAAVVLAELRRQLASRLHHGNIPEIAFLDADTRNILLALAVFTNVILSTTEIERRIAFLERLVRQEKTARTPLTFIPA